MNYLTLYGSKDQALHQEEVGPQHIKIRDEMEKVAAKLLGK